MVRVKYRYLLCEVNVPDRNSLLLLNDRAIAIAVREAVTRAHGDYGAAHCSIGFSVKYLNAYTGIVFLRFQKSHYRLIWSALPFITSVENRGRKVQCFLNCLHVGGTIRTCQKFLVRYNTQQLHGLLAKCQSQVEKTAVRHAMQNFCLLKRDKGVVDDEADSEEEDEEDDDKE